MLKMLTVVGFALAVTAGPAAAQFAPPDEDWGCRTCGYTNGLSTNGIRWNGLIMNGFRFNGVGMNGFRWNGLCANGYKWNGARMNGASIDHGWQVIAVDLPEVR